MISSSPTVIAGLLAGEGAEPGPGIERGRVAPCFLFYIILTRKYNTIQCKWISTVASLHRVYLKPLQTSFYSLLLLFKFVCLILRTQIPFSSNMMVKINMKQKIVKPYLPDLSLFCIRFSILIYSILHKVSFVRLLNLHLLHCTSLSPSFS